MKYSHKISPPADGADPREFNPPGRLPSIPAMPGIACWLLSSAKIKRCPQTFLNVPRVGTDGTNVLVLVDPVLPTCTGDQGQASDPCSEGAEWKRSFRSSFAARTRETISVAMLIVKTATGTPNEYLQGGLRVTGML